MTVPETSSCYGRSCFKKAQLLTKFPFHKAASKMTKRNSASYYCSSQIRVPSLPYWSGRCQKELPSMYSFVAGSDLTSRQVYFFWFFSTDQCCFAINYSLRAYRITLYNNSSFPFYDKTIDETLSVNPKVKRIIKKSISTTFSASILATCEPCVWTTLFDTCFLVALYCAIMSMHD